MGKQQFTAVQYKRQWEARLALESHHESSLPAQRYKARDAIPAGHNPIAVAELNEEETRVLQENLTTFEELNAPPRRPPILNNPIFGYSTHPPPKSDLDLSAKGGLASTAARQRMKELQEQLEEERKARKQLEEQLKSAH
ncbi:hypothetical protein AB1Y20_012379 [Prymnesium parvum]|uniref:Uncharacterized protein n=1 Tax=Prymnesium parvum TaxID=97485 RepID=A0AB34IRY2_PRYPA|mmetsp:Transcript_13475/g.33642  ORF Transcript_13475/g.33642 Transcript_13475/m.33642 type:complete len:140 (+) Transcript_13475:281-700(+)